VLEQLMADGERATCLFTDPPYGVDYVGKTAAALRIAGDTADGAPQLFADVLEQVRPHLAPGAAFYVCYPGGTGLALPFLAAMSTPPWRYRQGLVWCKSAFILGHSDYHFAHEDIAAGELTEPDPPADEAGNDIPAVSHASIAYGHVEGPGRGRGRRAGGWYGGHAESTVLHFPKPAANPDHPTPKPVGLVTRLITNSTRRGHLVLDPFAGSGSVLVAAHLSGRIARLVELDPRYADGICRRWQHLTGQPPVLTRTGKPVPFPPAQLVTTEEAS
jgi:DNA modification methylase